MGHRRLLPPFGKIFLKRAFDQCFQDRNRFGKLPSAYGVTIKLPHMNIDMPQKSGPIPPYQGVGNGRLSDLGNSMGVLRSQEQRNEGWGRKITATCLIELLQQPEKPTYSGWFNSLHYSN
ncbi:hypothetical protein L209DRAFT_561636 [Thermothelomyces heterothallicus CBS 203.75]